jgi:hypothetical protein
MKLYKFQIENFRDVSDAKFKMFETLLDFKRDSVNNVIEIMKGFKKPATANSDDPENTSTVSST